MNQIAIAILAAGSSKRMGQSKQLLPWGDSTLLGSIVKNTLLADTDKVFVVLGSYEDEIKRKTDLSGTLVIINENWHNGLGSTIALTAAEIDKKHPDIKAILFVLADQPFISSHHLNAIIQLHNKNKEAIIITKKEDYSGVPVLFPKFFFAELMLLSNDEGAKQIINSNKDQVIQATTRDNTVDIDTFDSYITLHKMAKAKKQ